MRMGRKASLIIIFMSFFIAFTLPIKASSLDELQEIAQTTEQEQEIIEELRETEVDSHYWVESEPNQESENALKQYLYGYKPVTEENMRNARALLNPITTLIGNITGCIVVFVVAFIFLITGIDLVYIAVPFTRSFLNPSVSFSSQGMPQQTFSNRGLRRKLVSDEASKVVERFGAQPSVPQQQMGFTTPSMLNQPTPEPMKIVIFEYLKARAIFLIVFAIATTLLLSSVFTDCGLNLAELGVKVMNRLNVGIQNVSI